MNLKLLPSLPVVALFVAFPGAAWGTTISLAFDSLPSAQGWTYESAQGTPEEAVFSISGGVLTQDTTANPWSSEVYKLYGVVDPSRPYTLTMTSRTLTLSGIPGYQHGFCYDARFAGQAFAIGIGTHQIDDVLGNMLSTTIDNTVFHEYRLEVTPDVGYRFIVDGALVATGPPRYVDWGNHLQLGDCDTGAGAHAEIIAFTFTQDAQIGIDIKPDSDTNSINPRAKGTIPVAILTTGDFDAWSVDALSVAFGPSAAPIAHSQGHAEDVDRDGDLDMVLHFRTSETGITCGETEASLTGETLGGQQFSGTDTIQTVGCK